MKRKFIKILLFSLFALSCKEEKPIEPEQDGTVETDTQLIVDKYILPAGETAEFPSGFEIIAGNGVDIQGDIVIKPLREGDFTIKCLNGDMILNGKISVDTTIRKSKIRKSGLNFLKTDQVAVSTNFNFILESSGGHLKIDRKFQAGSEDGMSAPDEHISGSELDGEGKYTGNEGGRGGYIYISANDGTIFFDRRESGDPPALVLGNGGSGANVIVETPIFNTAGSRLELIGGRGGNSGFLQIHGKEILGLENVPVFSFLDYGYGGSGGDVLWDVSGFLTGSAAPEMKYPLQEIIFKGGDGGDGISIAGDGGLAIYLSYRVINETGNPVASVSVQGGNGGNVIADYIAVQTLKPDPVKIPVPRRFVYGGNGGGFVALGNMGWDGVHPDSGGPVDGANGGNVTGIGGNGGNVEDGVVFLEEAGGGDGGQPSDEIDRNLAFFSYNISAANGDFTSLYYGVIAGSGGKGASVCEGCPGGNGGNAGDATAIGGNGGNAPHTIGGKGGKGGDVWTVASLPLQNSAGGNGNEPGKGGCPGMVTTAPGKGGLAYEPGADGNYLGQQQVNVPCASDGVTCGEELNKVTDHCGDDDTTDCWKKPGSNFTALYQTSRKVTISTGYWSEAKIIISEQGILTEISGQYNDRYRWDITGSKLTQIRTSDGRGDRDTIVYYSDYINNNRVSSPAHEARIPRCINGVLYLPTGNASAGYKNEFTDSTNGNSIQDEILLQFGGCNPFLVIPVYPDPSNWRCCDPVGYKGAAYGDCPQ